MKLYAPTYYKKFKCIADRCEHSCCIGWEIDIDENTLEKYKQLKGGYGEAIKNSISLEDTPHFRLGEGERCPHLDECGLCKIILSMGEDYLSDICREHPRFYNFTNVAEVGIGMSCPEAARLILSSPDYRETEVVGEVEDVTDDVPFDSCAARGEVYAMLEETDYTTALQNIYRKYAINVGNDENWLQTINSLEYLNADHKSMFLRYSSSLRPEEDKNEYLKRFLAYLIYRHCTESIHEEDFCKRLSFCLFCERLFSSLICSQKAETMQEIATLASILSEEIEYSAENTWTLMG